MIELGSESFDTYKWECFIWTRATTYAKKIDLFWSDAPAPNLLFLLWLLRSLYHDITKML